MEDSRNNAQQGAAERESARVRVLLADDNREICDYVAEVLIDADYDVIGILADGTRVLAATEALRPDVLIIDISIGAVSGIEVAKVLQRHGFQGNVVFLTIHEDQDLLRAAICVGGSAYVMKSRLDLDLLAGIQAALCDRMFISAPLQYSSQNG